MIVTPREQRMNNPLLGKGYAVIAANGEIAMTVPTRDIGVMFGERLRGIRLFKMESDMHLNDVINQVESGEKTLEDVKFNPNFPLNVVEQPRSTAKVHLSPVAFLGDKDATTKISVLQEHVEGDTRFNKTETIVSELRFPPGVSIHECVPFAPLSGENEILHGAKLDVTGEIVFLNDQGNQEFKEAAKRVADLDLDAPVKKDGRGRKPLHDFAGMKHGDVFVYPGSNLASARVMASLKTKDNPGKRFQAKEVHGKITITRIV